MSPPAVDALLYLLDEAFQGRGIEESSESQALLTNLATVDEATWRAKPPGATRTIESMVLHVGACKTMYDDYAFSTGKKQWGTPDYGEGFDQDERGVARGYGPPIASFKDPAGNIPVPD